MHKKAFDETQRLIEYLKEKGITEIAEDDLAGVAAEIEIMDSAYLMDYWEAIKTSLAKEGINVIAVRQFKGLNKSAYNDLLNKGFNSVRQECYLRINNPTLAEQIFSEHGHAHDWDKLKTDDWNRFSYVDDGQGGGAKKSKAASITLCSRLQKIADKLDTKGKSVAADKIDNLIKQIVRISK